MFKNIIRISLEVISPPNINGGYWVDYREFLGALWAASTPGKRWITWEGEIVIYRSGC